MFEYGAVFGSDTAFLHYLSIEESVRCALLHEELLVVGVVDRREDALEALASAELHLCILNDVELLLRLDR